MLSFLEEATTVSLINDLFTPTYQLDHLGTKNKSGYHHVVQEEIY